jgi:hypothetical protein
MIPFDLFYELLDLLFNLLLMNLIINVKKSSINCKNFHVFLSANPFFMSLMDTLNVLNFYLFFSFSISEFNSLVADLRWTFQVDDTFYRAILNKSLANWVVYFILVWLKISIFVHNLSENISISQWRSLREKQFIFGTFCRLFPEHSSWMKCI